MVTGDDDRCPRATYILGMQVLRSIRARAGYIEPWRLDLLIAVAFLIEAELEVLLLMDGAGDAWIAALLQAVLAVALAVRRTSPSVSLVLALGAFVAFQPLSLAVNDNIISAFFAVLFVLFSFGLHQPD